MKNKIIKIIGLIASIVILFTAGMYFVEGVMIPGLMPITLSIMMLSGIHSSWQQFREGKISQSVWKTTLILMLIAFILNIFAGVLQIIDAIKFR